MSKGARVRGNKKAKPNTGATSSQPPVYGSPEWHAATEIVSAYQSSINSISGGRKDVHSKLNSHWNDWYNALMTICFGLGGALIAAIALVPHAPVSKVLFLAGDGVLLLNGLYILFWRKRVLEKDSLRAIDVGYEAEYYALVAKNRVLDFLGGKLFDQAAFEAAKTKLLDVALNDLDESYEESRKINVHMDLMVAFFVLGLLLLLAATITSQVVLFWYGAIAYVGWVVLLIFFRQNVYKPKEAIAERDKWLEKIKPERQGRRER